MTLEVGASGAQVGVWLAPLVAFVISTVTSMGGVSGAFLLLPFQVSVLGITSPSVSATNHLFNVVAIPAGVLRYVREGRMLWPLTAAVVVGTLPGVLVGAVVRIVYLPDPTAFRAFAGLVLAWIGGRLLLDLVRPTAGTERAKAAESRFRSSTTRRPDVATAPDVTPVRTLAWTARRLVFEFGGEVFEVSIVAVAVLSLTVGVVGGIYGIGGGAIIAPFFVTVLGLPVYVVAGAALAGTLCTSLAGVAFFQLLAPFFPQHAVAPDWTLGLLFGVGGAAGMYCGARLQRRVPAAVIKWTLVAVILFVATRYLGGVLRLL